MSPSKLSIQDMQVIAQEKNGKCLSLSYIDCDTKLRWKCEEGHQWEATPTNVKRGRWCKKCACIKSASQRKLTIDGMRSLAASRGGKCLSQTYANSSTKLLWQCHKGHQWEATPAHIKSGTWCEKCKREHAYDHCKLTIDEMHEIAIQRGGVCLSEKYVNSNTPLEWRCGNGHKWRATPSSIKKGSWCRLCFEKRISLDLKSSIEDMQEIAAKKGGNCLSKEYINSKTSLKWQCKYGHIWKTTPDSIKSGNWCSVCARNKKSSLQEMHTIAQKLGGKCSSDHYFNNQTKLLWECTQGHHWYAKPGHVKDGHWCPECRGSKKLTIEDMHRLAISRGGKCLSDTYINNFTKLKWECSNGHQWEAIPLSVRKGHWCGTCSSGLGERICRAFFEQIFKKTFPKLKPKWLINNEGNRMELDGYCRSLNIAFEHHGEQHYSKNNIYIKESEYLEKRKMDDRLKEKLCKDKGILLVVIPEIPKKTPVEDVKPIIKKQLLLYKRKIPEDFDEVTIDLKKAYSIPDFVHQYKALLDIAKDRGGKCLSPHYKGNHIKLRWECGVCGYVWRATPASIKRGSWCEKCGRIKGTANRKHTIEMMRSIARERGGKCLSNEYLNANSELKWECAKGHQWFATPHSVKNSRTWCQVCKDRGNT